MQAREWALVAFTLLMQSSIGTVLVLVTATLGSARGSHSSHAGLPIAVAAVAAALALIASLFHLGHPAQAWLALTNVRSSWLSREIVLSGLFTLSVCALLVERWQGSAAPGVVAAVAGAAALYAMSRLYMVPAQPAWNSLTTPAMFVASTFTLGIVVVIATSSFDPAVVRGLTMTAIVLIALQVVFTSAYVRGMPAEPAAAVSLAATGSGGAWLIVARIVTGAVAVVLLAFAVSAGSGFASAPAAFAVALAITSELIGRVLFYAGRVMIGPV